MNIFGFSLTRQKAVTGLQPVAPGSGGWINLIRESFSGAWQRNIEVNVNSVLTHTTVFSCISLISTDISKLRIRLVEQDSNGIWNEVETNSPFWPVLRKPNRYQTILQFIANWVESKLIHGNAYILKAYDARPVVSQLYVLDPSMVTVLCAPDGTVFYELRADHLTGQTKESVAVPASDIIHDRWNTFHHPLVGISPLQAAGLSAMQGLRIQENETRFFESGANPGGILTAPGHINDDTARRLKDYWDRNYGSGGPSVGKVAVLGDGLEYRPLMMTAVDSQLIEQLRMTAEAVCSAFHVPKHMVGIGEPPTYNNVEALNQYYYSNCLQGLIENIEKLLDEGLSLPKPLGTEFDTESGLFRMDTVSKVKSAGDAIGSGAMAPNEARKRYFDLGPVPGGEGPYLQQQQFSLAALAERDRDKPFAKPTNPAPAAPATQVDDADGNADNGGEERRANNVVYLAERLIKRASAIERSAS